MPLENFLTKFLDSVLFTLISYHVVNEMLKTYAVNKKFRCFPFISIAIADLFLKN